MSACASGGCTLRSMLLLLVVVLLMMISVAAGEWLSLLLPSENSEFPTDYGVDVSFPIHHAIDRSRYAYYSNRYLSLLAECHRAYSPAECDAYERDRMAMNLAQPRTQYNYTDVGFHKQRAPTEVFDALLSFFTANQMHAKSEEWPRGNTYVNSWHAPSLMVSLEEQSYSMRLPKELIWNAIRPILEKWTGHRVQPTSIYGIRIYSNGSILAPHVDRLPLVSSCIIQVAQDVEEPWALEVYDHQGVAHNVTMSPGDMVLYESHSVIHGRPVPLRGSFYANVFVHFQPVDHEAMNAQLSSSLRSSSALPSSAPQEKRSDPFRRRMNRQLRGHSQRLTAANHTSA